jgi:hypothetical protein
MSKHLPSFSDDPDEFAAKLLSTAADDEPARGALEKVAGSLGVSAAALAASGASAHAATSGAGAATHKLTLASLVKWLAAGVGAGVVASGGAHFVAEQTQARAVALPGAAVSATLAPGRPERLEAQRTEPASSARPPLERPTSAPAPSAAALVRPRALAPEDDESTNVTAPVLPLPPPSSATFAPLDTAPAPTASAEVAPVHTLGEETRALDQVRAELARGRSNEALAELERYRARWPHAALSAEASLLRVEALLRSGRRAEAEREVDALGARAPRSGYASRARALLDAARPDKMHGE